MKALNDNGDFGGRPHQTRYELIDKDGQVVMRDRDTPARFDDVETAATAAKLLWGDQEQDEDRTGKGWDIQVVGA